MRYTHVLIRYGELTTKGKNRKDFINALDVRRNDKTGDSKKIKIGFTQ